MATQIYRVARVLTAPSSPVARLHAVDEDGLELRLEVPTELAQRVTHGQVLVVNWSVHTLPEPLRPVATDEPAAPAALAPSSTAAHGPSADDAFMALMARVRRGASAPREPFTPSTSPVHQTRGVPDIDDEFNTLLGPAQTRGMTNGR